MRLQDRTIALPESGSLSVGLLTRTWRHTDPQPGSIGQVSIQGTPEALSIECFGTGATVPLRSPAARASALFAASAASREAMSFFVELDSGYMSSFFQGNVNLGLLVLAGFHDFKDGSARSNYFSREFFYSVADPETQLPTPDSPTHAAGSSRLDPSALLGFWRNTNRASLGVAAIEITDRDQEVGIRAYGVAESGTLDWGETTGSVYAKDCVSPDAIAFSAASGSTGIRCSLQANVKQGVLVVAYFTEFTDGSGRSNYFSREFYYKER
jgi:hypothetical protein